MQNNNIWVISKGEYIDCDISHIVGGAKPIHVQEYKISDIGDYLLCPANIKIPKKIVGCEVEFKKSLLSRIPILSFFSRKSSKNLMQFQEPVSKEMPLRDENLESHFRRISSQLVSYNNNIKKLKNIDLSRVKEIVGYCREPDTSYSFLPLTGEIEEKMAFIINNFNYEVYVVNKSPSQGSDLFEMRGFDFSSYDSENSHRLLRYMQDGVTNACVVTKDNKIRYSLKDITKIKYLKLLEHSVNENILLKNSIESCINGKSKPFRLFFNNSHDINYSEETDVPKTYREIFEAHQFPDYEIQEIIGNLINSQTGVIFSYIPCSARNGQNNFEISVWHDIKAIEKLKDNNLKLYNELKKKATNFEGDMLYYLDSIHGEKK